MLRLSGLKKNESTSPLQPAELQLKELINVVTETNQECESNDAPIIPTICKPFEMIDKKNTTPKASTEILRDDIDTNKTEELNIECDISSTTSHNTSKGSSSLCESSSSVSVDDNDGRKYNCFSFSLSNACSLAKKVGSLIDLFREKKLHAAMINETWFKNDRDTAWEIEDIKNAEKIEFICKNRGRRGGGCLLYTSPSPRDS